MIVIRIGNDTETTTSVKNNYWCEAVLNNFFNILFNFSHHSLHSKHSSSVQYSIE